MARIAEQELVRLKHEVSVERLCEQRGGHPKLQFPRQGVSGAEAIRSCNSPGRGCPRRATGGLRRREPRRQLSRGGGRGGRLQARCRVRSLRYPGGVPLRRLQAQELGRGAFGAEVCPREPRPACSTLL